MGLDTKKAKRLKRTQEAMLTPPIVNTDVDINIEKCKHIKEEKKYKCTCCGDSWVSQKNYFTKSQSVLYQSNNGYMTICNDCRDAYYYQLIELYNGSEEKAIEHMCRQFGWIYDIEALDASEQVSGGKSRLSNYLLKKNLNQTTRNGFTDIDTVKNEYIQRQKELEELKDTEIVDSIEDLKDYDDIDPNIVKFWGLDYQPQDYKTLQGYYDELIRLCDGKPDIKQKKIIKNLCLLEYQMQKNIQSGKDIGTLSNSYKSLFESSGLKSDEIDINNDQYGTWLADIERYTPAEFYKDKNKYRDFFGLKEYVERFMFRPYKNLFTGSKDKDEEFWINDEKDGE